MAGFFVYRSNRLDVLAEILGQRLSVEPLPDPFAEESIVIGSRGMETWLRRCLAEKHDICAHINFPFPSTLINHLAQLATQEDISEKMSPNPWESHTLEWVVLRCIEKLIDQPNFAAIRAYLQDDPTTHVSRKRWALAHQIARVFDHYIAYRGPWAQAWSQNKSIARLAAHESAMWQNLLWVEVQRYLGVEAQHLASRVDQMRSSKARARLRDSGHQRIHFFALPTLAPTFLDCVRRVSEAIDVHLYVLSPSAFYWEELQVQRSRLCVDAFSESLEPETFTDELSRSGMPEHPLLSSLGRVARDFQMMLDDTPDAYLDRTGEISRDISCFVDAAKIQSASTEHKVSHLQWLQSDIFNLRHPASQTHKRPFDTEDDSVQVHVCHSSIRQVEVLHQNLTTLFERHSDLQPRDVLVMVPDIGHYAPLIRGVFTAQAEASREVNLPPIPYRIADMSVRTLNPLVDVLVGLLEMSRSRMEASKVADFIDLDVVRNAFDFQEQERATIRQWLQQSAVSWGLDASHRARSGQPEQAQNTWSFALQRLALGVAMSDESQVFYERAPVEGIEGQEFELLGRLMDATALLFHWLAVFQKPHTLSLWVEHFQKALRDLTRLPQQAHSMLERLDDEFDKLKFSADVSNLQTPVDGEVMLAYLSKHLEVPSHSPQEARDVITFCAMLPMRNIPHKVVYLMGLDEDTFPRQGFSHSFDLSHQPRRVGDRDVRDEDRFLFLEAIMAARTHFVVSYAGFDLYASKRRSLSAPVAQWLDILELSFDSSKDGSPLEHVVYEHPLQPFSPRNFLRGEAKSYSQPFCRAAMALGRPKAHPEFFLDEKVEVMSPGTREVRAEVDFRELHRFYNDPTRYYFENILNYRLPKDDLLLKDREPIELDGLERWLLNSDLLKALHGDDPVDAIVRLGHARGSLPAGSGAVYWYEKQKAAVMKLISAVSQLGEIGLVTTSLAKKVEWPDLVLHGSLSNINDKILIRIHPGTHNVKHILRLWIDYLILQATGDDRDQGAALFAFKTGAQLDPKCTRISQGLDAQVARNHLRTLIEHFMAGSQRLAHLPHKYSVLLANTIFSSKQKRSAQEFCETEKPKVTEAFDRLRRDWLYDIDKEEVYSPTYQSTAFDGHPFLRGEASDEYRMMVLKSSLDLWAPLLDLGVKLD
jgi:exodeoxyribonuclease V gamma subunit